MPLRDDYRDWSPDSLKIPNLNDGRSAADCHPGTVRLLNELRILRAQTEITLRELNGKIKELGLTEDKDAANPAMVLYSDLKHHRAQTERALSTFDIQIKVL